MLAVSDIFIAMQKQNKNRNSCIIHQCNNGYNETMSARYCKEGKKKKEIRKKERVKEREKKRMLILLNMNQAIEHSSHEIERQCMFIGKSEMIDKSYKGMW